MLRSLLSFVFDVGLVVYFFQGVAPARKKNKWLIGLGFLCLLLLGSIYLPGSENIVESSTLRFAYRVLCYFLFLLCTKEMDWMVAFYDSVFCAVLCLIYQNIFMTPLWVDSFLPPLSKTQRPIPQVIIYTLIMYTMIGILYVIVAKTVDLKETKSVSIMQILVQLAALTCSLYVKRTLLLLSDAESVVQQDFSVFSILLQGFLLIFIVLFERYVHTQDVRRVMERQKIANRYLLKHLQDRKEYDEKARSIRHDWKNHMLVINQMAQNAGAAEIENYIKNLMDELTGTGIRVETGNMLMDGLLTIKVNEAERKDIDVNLVADFRAVDFISETDLCTVMGNALDNAIEAAERTKKTENRFIEIRSGSMAGCLITSISNGYEGKIKTQGEHILTTKRDRKTHGYGLGNMRRTVEKYDGVIDINTENKNIFTLTITIPIPKI